MILGRREARGIRGTRVDLGWSSLNWKAFLKRSVYYPLREALPVLRQDRPAGVCMWPWRALVIYCDLDTTCNCGTSLKQLLTGNVRSGVRALWHGKLYSTIRQGWLEGKIPYFCRGCPVPFMKTLNGYPYLLKERPQLPDSPPILQIEPTAACNLRCPQKACDQKLIRKHRRKMSMSFEEFRRLIDEVGRSTETINFFNFGEPFMNKDAISMIAYAKKVNPQTFILSDTNGHYLQTRAKQEAIVASGIDRLVFSVDGASQSSYEKYRVRGKLETVLQSMRAIVEIRDRRGLSKPEVIWKYILFRTNDSDEEIRRAEMLAEEIGVPLRWHLTTFPPGWPSLRFPCVERLPRRMRDNLFCPDLA
jgi:pyruvate-formate lyase-activating enzyme